MSANLDRDPLTMRYARTLKDTVRDPSDWWQSAESAVAEEEHIRAMFAEPAMRESRSNVWAERVLYVFAASVLFAYLKGWI
jgi:hypothetical protein